MQQQCKPTNNECYKHSKTIVLALVAVSIASARVIYCGSAGKFGFDRNILLEPVVLSCRQPLWPP